MLEWLWRPENFVVKLGSSQEIVGPMKSFWVHASVLRHLLDPEPITCLTHVSSEKADRPQAHLLTNGGDERKAESGRRRFFPLMWRPRHSWVERWWQRWRFGLNGDARTSRTRPRIAYPRLRGFFFAVAINSRGICHC